MWGPHLLLVASDPRVPVGHFAPRSLVSVNLVSPANCQGGWETHRCTWNVWGASSLCHNSLPNVCPDAEHPPQQGTPRD